jgi:hypothetical protein
LDFFCRIFWSSFADYLGFCWIISDLFCRITSDCEGLSRISFAG